MGPDPAVAAVRNAVRRVLSEIDPGGLVLAACSGGADSLALAAALVFETSRSGHRAGGITVDHGLQKGSADRAGQVVRLLRDLGLDPVDSVAVKVDRRGGIEAAARDARYAALRETATRRDAAAVLLGHTLDDQAETVLLGLARGSGGRSLAGMPPEFDRGGVRFTRPLLGLDRATTRRACQAMDLPVWEDPHNDDPAYTRVRVRRDALPALERALGPGVAAALARTARMLRADADALDSWADRAYKTADLEVGVPSMGDEGALTSRSAKVALDVAALAELPPAVRTRVLRRAAIEAGSPPGTLAAVHIDEVDRLITDWHGQQHVDLPGPVRAVRRCGKLLLRSERRWGE